ncbi:MAG: imidazole glycerol phosphate synthase cyclase subunit [Alphaproteobacteria bacterium]
MLKKRVIPTLLVKDIGLVKGVGFDSWRRVGTVLPAVKVYNRRQVDELIILDISATKNNKSPDVEEIKTYAQDCTVPLTVGGGIRDIDTIKKILRSGADKISLNSICYENPNFIQQAAEIFGTQCIVVSIDVRKSENGRYYCYSHSGKKPQELCPVEWAREAENLGAGEILLTSIELDGTMKGYDLDLISRVSGAVKIPVIASGGAKDYEDFRRAIQDSGAQAVSAASMYHFTEQTPLEAKTYLSQCGVPVRKI